MQEVNYSANPFPGLRPFESTETYLFFGRDGQSEELLRRLRRTRFLAVVGTSGSGKSSLVRAGLLPALQGGLMASAGSDWRIAILRPGNDPIGNLARALASPAVLGSRAEKTEDMQDVLAETTLRRSSLGLVELVRRARAKLDRGGESIVRDYENLLVIVDQFEEIFRFKQLIEEENTKEDAAAFVKLLLEAVRQPEAKIYVVLTMRSDFLGDCSQFWELPEAINDGQYLIPRLTRDERREAIVGPIAVGEGVITDPLVNQLLNDVGDNRDQLPILQHALMRTWDYWLSHRRNGEPIDISHYNATGGMAEALSRHADEAYAELSDAQKMIAEKLFKGLTEKGADNREIRRPMEVQEICELTGGNEATVTAVIEVFRREGRSFLMPPPTDALTGAPVNLNFGSLIDISHESLIRNWDRLKTWVDEESRTARIYRRLAETAVLHREGGAGLWRDPDLQLALNWRDESKPNKVWARRYHPEFELAMSFLDASVAARDAATREAEKQRRAQVKRARVIALFFALAFLLACAALIFANSQRVKAREALKEADEQRNEAVKQKEIAEEERRNAEKQARIASDETVKASREKVNAEQQREIAVAKSKEADQQSKIALAKSKEANKQKQVALRLNESVKTANKSLEAVNKSLEAQIELVKKARTDEEGQRQLAEERRKEAEANAVRAFEVGKRRLVITTMLLNPDFNKFDDVSELESGDVLFGVGWWNLKGGRLKKLLLRFQTEEPELFAQIFGDGDAKEAQKLIDFTSKPGSYQFNDEELGEIKSLIQRFKKAGENPALQAVQIRAFTDDYVKFLSELEGLEPRIKSERGVAFMLDLASQHGPGGARHYLAKAQQAGSALTETQLLQRIRDINMDEIKKLWSKRAPNVVRSAEQRRQLFLTSPYLSNQELGFH
jgi:energy-coupling factor transporter ATP-binding protein EcfA2